MNPVIAPSRPWWRGAPTAAAAALVVVALGAWWVAARREASAPQPKAAQPAASAPAAAAVALSASQVEAGIARVQDSLQREPRDAAGWAMLAHSYAMLGRFDEANPAYARLLALRPDDAQVHADAAESLAAARGGSLQGPPAALVARALQLDATNLKALGLAAKEAFELRRYAQAEAFWQRALQVAQDPDVRRQITLNMAEAHALGGPAAASAPAAAGMAFVAGRVTVAPALKARIAPDDTVFVFARPASGSRMPVALLRRHGRDLPLDFALDDTLAMVPQARLSQQQQVLVGVRVSRRGDAIAVAGDLQGQVGPVALGTSGLRLEINDVVK